MRINLSKNSDSSAFSRRNVRNCNNMTGTPTASLVAGCGVVSTGGFRHLLRAWPHRGAMAEALMAQIKAAKEAKAAKKAKADAAKAQSTAPAAGGGGGGGGARGGSARGGTRRR